MGKIICKVKVVRNFKDIQLGRSVKVGEVYEVNKDRADQLVDLKFVQVIEVATPEKVEEAVKEEVQVEEVQSKSEAKRIEVVKKASKRGGKRISKKK